MNNLGQTLLIVGLVALIFFIIAILVFIFAARRVNIAYKKMDYLIEDWTYKSEMLNPAVETVAKISNYIDLFEVVAKRNVKTASKLILKNKDEIYRVLDRLKKIATFDEKGKKGKK